MWNYNNYGCYGCRRCGCYRGCRGCRQCYCNRWGCGMSCAEALALGFVLSECRYR